MRPDRLRLRDIADACAAIDVHVAGDAASIATNSTVRAAVLHELTVIGEAASRVSEDLRGSGPEIPWRPIVGFRNLVVHEYFGISASVLESTVRVDVPDLAEKIQAVLERLPDEPGSV